MSGDGMSESMLKNQAIAILRNNDRGGYTVPTARLYPYQWNWDAGFSALGWACFDEARAWQELHKLFEGQWHDGLLPHIVFHQHSPDYFPGPEIWGVKDKAAPATSGISQPPVSASITRWLLDSARDQEYAQTQVAALFPKLYAHHRWWHELRDPGQTGLVCSYHPWETGRDNSPEWDAALAAVPASGSTFQRRDTALVDSDQRPHQHEYQRYIYLVELFRSLDYEPAALYRSSPFKVNDIGINAILRRADQDLLALAQRFATAAEQAVIERWLERSQTAFDRLWNSGLRCYNSYDLIADQPSAMACSAGFLPLFAGLPNAARAERMVRELQRWQTLVRYLVPSLAPDHAQFEPQRYWRGPVWSIVNYMIAVGLQDYGYRALAGQIRNDTAALTASGEFPEYFHPLSGVSCGGRQFSWTAAIGLYWLFD
jgi:alpha,alpha-trehalase